MRQVESAVQPTRLVVLADSVGSRPRGKTNPNPLVELGGISLVERAIAGAEHVGFDEVVVVTGYRADQIRLHVLDVSRRRGIPVTVVRNDRHLEGDGLSVLAARGEVGDLPFALVMVERVFSHSLLRRLRHTAVEPGQVVVMVDRRHDRAVGVDPGHAMKVRIGDGSVRAIGQQVPMHDALGVGAFACGPALYDAVETAVTAGDSSLAAAIQVLADAGAARALAIGDDEWWFDVETPRGHRNGSHHIIGAAGKPLDGTLAVRVNGILSQRVITPALLALFSGITPNRVTLIAFAVAVAAALSFARGAPAVGGLLVALASVLDRSDGEVARITYRSSTYGGFLDAVVDRAADGIVFTGVAVYLATDTRLGALGGALLVPLGLSVTGAALVGHLLVSYTTAKAAVDLGHRYGGTLLGGGRGRDRRLLLVSVGGLAAAIEPVALLLALLALALLSALIVVARLRWSWWVSGRGAHYIDVGAVVLDFDGTVADSMGFLTDLAVELLVDELGFERAEAARQYIATAGTDFASQLDELAAGHPGLGEIASRFEAEKTKRWRGSAMFTDVVPAVERLGAAGVPVLLCSSTRAPLVREFCDRFGLRQRFASVDGWAPGHTKSIQLGAAIAALGLAGHEVLFVGDTRRDADVAVAAGARFVGLVRKGHPDAFAGSGAMVAGSLSEVAADLVRTVRSPVDARAPETGSGAEPRSGSGVRRAGPE